MLFTTIKAFSTVNITKKNFAFRMGTKTQKRLRLEIQILLRRCFKILKWFVSNLNLIESNFTLVLQTRHFPDWNMSLFDELMIYFPK